MLKDKSRFIYMFVVGIAISFLLKATVYSGIHNHPAWNDHLITVLITFSLWEGNLHIDDWMNKHFSWLHHTKKRVLFHSLVALLFSSVTLFTLMYVHNSFICGVIENKERLMSISFIIGLCISFFILSIEISGQLLKGWKNSLIELEKHKTENAQAQLQNLKDQINPHFLFNNLSVLSSLVYQDQDKAADFIHQLSKVYRYLLDNKSNELVRLVDEFKFVDAYIYLLQIRFDKNLKFEMDIEEGKLIHYIPPMSLQMLIENAIKHNEISSAHPLSVHIKTIEHSLEVSNNYQPRSQMEDSSRSGLQNIKDRYKYFTDKMVEIQQSDTSFTVRIPLLEEE